MIEGSLNSDRFSIIRLTERDEGGGGGEDAGEEEVKKKVKKISRSESGRREKTDRRRKNHLHSVLFLQLSLLLYI